MYYVCRWLCVRVHHWWYTCIHIAGVFSRTVLATIRLCVWIGIAEAIASVCVRPVSVYAKATRSSVFGSVCIHPHIYMCIVYFSLCACVCVWMCRCRKSASIFSCSVYSQCESDYMRSVDARIVLYCTVPHTVQSVIEILYNMHCSLILYKHTLTDIRIKPDSNTSTANTHTHRGKPAIQPASQLRNGLVCRLWIFPHLSILFH